VVHHKNSVLKHIRLKKLHSKVAPVAIILIIAVLGFYILTASHAQGPYANTNISAGTLSCGAIQDTDSGADNNDAVRFGPLPTTVAGTTTENTTAQVFGLGAFDDSYWYFPASTSGYTTLTMNVTPEADGSPDGYFFATEFYFESGTADTGYMGIQTISTGIGSKGDIFSIWGAVSASDAQYITPFTEGTSGLSTRNAYNWVVGHMYTFTVQYLSTQSDGEHWESLVTDDTTCIQSVIGQIVTPTSYGLLTGSIGSFHERYSGETTSCSAMGLSDVEFTNPVMDGSVVPYDYENVIPDVTGCSSYYGVENIPGGYRSVIGGQPPSQ
jgi:hypothetical protein